MESINNLLKTLLTTPEPAFLLLASLIFFFVAVAGSIDGKINPGKSGRITSGLIGSVLLFLSLNMAKSAQIPPGSYQGSCSINNTYIQDDVLYSTCKRIDGEYKPTQLSNFKDCIEKGINNENGSLECGR
jgi:hypothetical protein